MRTIEALAIMADNAYADEVLDRLDGILHALARTVQGSYPLCPIDGCLLAHRLEACPQCAVINMTERCDGCGTAVSPWAPCPVCSLYRITGRRSLVRPVVVE